MAEKSINECFLFMKEQQKQNIYNTLGFILIISEGLLSATSTLVQYIFKFC